MRHSRHRHFRLRLIKRVEADLKVRAFLKKERFCQPPPGRQSLHWVVWKVPYRVRLPWPGELPIGVAATVGRRRGCKEMRLLWQLAGLMWWPPRVGRVRMLHSRVVVGVRCRPPAVNQAMGASSHA